MKNLLELEGLTLLNAQQLIKQMYTVKRTEVIDRAAVVYTVESKEVNAISLYVCAGKVGHVSWALND